MKNISRILSILVAISMLFGTVTYAAEFSDVTTENAYYEPIKILSALSIINGYEDGTFGPDRDVTRAEFATMLMRAMAIAGLGSPDPAGTPFTDLGDASWAIGDIRTAYDLGIINGMTETTFEPNSKVTYEQALKMIVCALNYGEQATSIQTMAPNMPWYYGYLQTARNIGLVDGVTIVETQPAKRKEIAQMIYNALDVYMLEKVEVSGGGNMYMESSQTWLKDKLKVTRGRGELLADESNTLDDSGAVARTGQALLTDEVNKTKITVEKNGISLSGLLGKSVEYFYKTDDFGVKTLILIYSRSGSSQVVKVDAVNIANITGSYSTGYTVSYYESLDAVRPINLTVAPNPTISINGEVKQDVTSSQLMIEGGTLEFISDGGSYSKINVESLETYVVKSVNKADKYIVDMYRATGSNTLYIDDENDNLVINMKNASGSVVSVSSIAQYNVLTVRKGKGPAGRTALDITVSTKNASGAIKEIDGDILNINGTNYEISSYLRKYGISSLDSFKVGDTCKAYLDKDGRIAYIMKTASNSAFFGYIGAVSVSNDDVVKIALISKKTPTMGSTYINVANRVKIDGESYSDTDAILDALSASTKVENTNIDGKGNEFSQLVKYTINANGEITDIDTAYTSEKEDPADETILKPFDVKRKDGKVMTYSTSGNTFTGADKSSFRINSSTEVFLVPTVKEDGKGSRSDFESYGRKTSSFFKTGRNYMVEPYNVTGGLNTAEVVIVYETDDIASVVEYNTPLFIITSISQKSNPDGDASDYVKGYQVTGTGAVSEKEYYTSDTNVISGKYDVGDALIFVQDNKGYINEKTIIHALDADDFGEDFELNYEAEKIVVEDKKMTIKVGSTTHYTTLYKGLLWGADDDATFKLSLVNDFEECEDGESVTLTAGSSVKYFVYDSETEKITQQDSYDLTSLASYNTTKDAEEKDKSAANLFVYSYYGSIKAIIVVK